MLENIKKIDKNKVLFCLEMIFYLYCFVKMCLNLCYGTEAMYQTIRDHFNYKAIAYFLAILLMVRRAKLLHFAPIAYSVFYVIGSVLYFKRAQFEIELYNANLSRCIAYGLFFLLIIDFFVSKNIVKWKERNKVLTIMFLATIAISAILSPGRTTLCYFICPFAALYFVKITKTKWKQLMNCLSVSMWLSNMWVMCKSLLEVPYEGGRYWGVFLNLSTIGLFCAGAATSAIYWFFLVKGKGVKANILRCLSVCAFLIPFYFVMLVSARVAQLALILVIAFGFVMWSGYHSTDKIKKGAMIGGAVLFACAILLVLALWGLYKVDVEEIKSTVNNEFLREQLLYWNGRAKTTFTAKSATFEHGTLLAMMDRFTSGRLGIWVTYFKEMNLLGHEGVYSLTSNWIHPHNNYVAWLYQYGLIGGSAFLAWFVYLNVCMIKKSYKSGDKKYLFPSLWCILTICSMLTETILWIYLSAFVLLFMQYIVMIDIPEDEECDIKKQDKKNIVSK